MELSLKKMFELKREEQKEIFNNIINAVEEKNNINTKEAKDEVFFLLDKMKVYFFSFMDDEEKNIWIDKSISYINEQNEFCYQMMESMSIIYKFVNKENQNKIFNCFYKNHEYFLSTNRGITTVSIFIKNTHKDYDKSQISILDEIMHNFKNACPGQLSDTYDYIEKNNFKEFKKSKNAKVLLLIPEFQTATSFLQPPLDFINVYQNLKDKGIDVDLFDNRVYSYSFKDVLSLIEGYDYIAMTSSPLDQVQTYFLDYRHTLFCKMVNFIKDNLKDLKKIIICGSHETVRPDIIKNTVNFDILIKGEYDYSLPDVIEGLIKNDDITKYLNLIIKDNNNFIETDIDNEKMHPSKWEESITNYDIINVEDYYGYKYINNTHLKQKNWAVVQTTRGCPFNCIFCFNFYTKKVRYKKIENVIQELKMLEKQHVEELFFIDQTFTVNKDYTVELCKKIVENNIHIKWSCETRIDLMDEDIIKWMKKAGCSAIWFGVETFDEDLLKINKKGYTKSDFTETINLLNKYDLDYRAFIMIGMYGETKESLKNTVDKIIKYRIKLSKTIVQCQERYGTELFDLIDEKEKEKLNRFEIMGLRKGRLSKKITQEDINEAVKRLMQLANKNE
jgi:radical SAM superfamily enzyme YgiQ (UPF0313 family)